MLDGCNAGQVAIVDRLGLIPKGDLETFHHNFDPTQERDGFARGIILIGAWRTMPHDVFYMHHVPLARSSCLELSTLSNRPQGATLSVQDQNCNCMSLNLL